MKKKGALFIGGLGPQGDEAEKWIQGRDLICAADSGLEACAALGISPHGIVGDMDSLSDKALLSRYPSARIEISSVDKDLTDTELGLQWLRERQCGDIVILGGGEGRLDHTLALTALFDLPDPPSCWVTAREVVSPLEGRVVIAGAPGEGLSLVPAGEGPWETRSRGLQWELNRLPWTRGMVGISNRLTRSEAWIEALKGRFLLIRPQ